MDKQFQLEQNELLKTVLDLRYFSPWRDTVIDQGSLQHDSNLEIYITNVCNQKCEYCYLVNQPDLYPADKRDPELLLNNLILLYDWILDNGFSIPRVDLYSGEIWHSDFGLKILEISLTYIKKGMKIGWFMIPSNCSFVFDEIQLSKIQNYIDAFRANGSGLVFSISVDGAIVDDFSRPMNNGKNRTEEYYNRLFLFAKFNNFYFHPMVAATNIDYWCDNYDWWKEQYKYWDMDINTLMMLEVRNNNWSEEAINKYNLFMDKLIEEQFIKCKNDIKTFSERLLGIRQYLSRHQKNSPLSGYIPYAFPPSDTFLGCGAANLLTVRLGDLAIVPCHRTAYNKLLFGYFVVEDNEIVDIIANNPQMAIQFTMANVNLSYFGCDVCTYRDYCLKGCNGCQYEEMGDPFIPIPGVCNFFKKKYNHLLKKYQDMGVLDFLKTISPYEADYHRVKDFLTLVRKWEESND